MRSTVEKVLSANDTGETHAHQAGLLIPKNIARLEFFPKLDPSIKNPRCVIDLRDAAGEEWTFNYIYYNNALFGGTRNEYRLTSMTEFLRHYDLKEGDTVVFKRPTGRFYGVDYRRKHQGLTTFPSGRKVLKLSGNWIILDTDDLS
ncbi:EcoRII N-terminal effector-binding domain-containing protein [Luteolibacter luteus]|nr:EcoRII N-terminal effector-binding domain-containing protein [Luteolibacter luteus]